MKITNIIGLILSMCAILISLPFRVCGDLIEKLFASILNNGVTKIEQLILMVRPQKINREQAKEEIKPLQDQVKS